MTKKRLGIRANKQGIAMGGLLLLFIGCNQDLGGADMESAPDMVTPVDMTITLKGSCDLRKTSPASQELSLIHI